MQDLEDVLLEPFPTDGLMVPLVRLTLEEQPPDSEIRVGGQRYRYDRSYPIKGHSAIMPRFLREQMAAGKKPLIVERPSRYYVYFAV